MQKEQTNPVNFNLDPLRTPVLMADGYLIGSNDHTLIFNFLQALPAGTQQQIISRVAMTRQQSKEFLKNLNDHIQKFEI